MKVGPFRIEILEPMKRTRVILDDNTSGIACDLVFSARTGAIQEARQTLWNGTRRTMDVKPGELHERTPLVLGSRDEVAAVVAQFGSPADAMP